MISLIIGRFGVEVASCGNCIGEYDGNGVTSGNPSTSSSFDVVFDSEFEFGFGTDDLVVTVGLTVGEAVGVAGGVLFSNVF